MGNKELNVITISVVFVCGTEGAVTVVNFTVFIVNLSEEKTFSISTYWILI